MYIYCLELMVFIFYAWTEMTHSWGSKLVDVSGVEIKISNLLAHQTSV